MEPIRLFHRTSAQGYDAIPREGFREGERGGVWLSKHLDCWGEAGRHILTVVVEMTEDELSLYAHVATADEVWDDEADDFVPCPPDEVERFVWYEVPSSVLNGRCQVIPSDHLADSPSP